MLEELQQVSKTYALADDLVSAAEDEPKLYKTIEILERNCEQLGLKINKAKSGIMIIKDT